MVRLWHHIWTVASLIYGVVVFILVVTTNYNPSYGTAASRALLHVFSFGFSACYLLIAHIHNLFIRQILILLRRGCKVLCHPSAQPTTPIPSDYAVTPTDQHSNAHKRGNILRVGTFGIRIAMSSTALASMTATHTFVYFSAGKCCYYLLPGAINRLPPGLQQNWEPHTPTVQSPRTSLLVVLYITVLACSLFEGFPVEQLNITQDTPMIHCFQIALGSTITRFALMHMIAVNVAAWIESTRLESDEMVHADAVGGHAQLEQPEPSEISLNEAWTAVARVCAAKFWILASGQLFILWLCCGYAMEALRSGVEVGVKFVERKNRSGCRSVSGAPQWGCWPGRRVLSPWQRLCSPA